MILPILDVKDVDASIAFYTEKLGFKKDMALDGPDGKTAFAFVSLGDSMVGFNRAQSEKVGQGVDFMIYVPEDQDLDAYYADVKAKNVTLKSEIKTQYWGDRTFSLNDPDGYSLTLCKTEHETDMDHVADVMSGKVQAE